MKRNQTDLQVGDRVPLLGVDEAWEEEGVTDEEDGGVVAHQWSMS